MANDKPPLAEAAIEGFPARHARFVDADLSPDGSQGLGLILLNPSDDVYPMMVWLEYSSDGWSALQATELVENGTDRDPLTGQHVSWVIGQAPSGATRATLSAGKVRTSRAVVDGWYVLAIWQAIDESAPTSLALSFEPTV